MQKEGSAMETHKSQQKKQVSKVATIVFVFMAALFLYTVVRLSGYLVRQELAGIPTPKNPEQNRVEEPAETPEAQPDATANVVIAVRTPAPESPAPTPAAPDAAAIPKTPIAKNPACFAVCAACSASSKTTIHPGASPNRFAACK